jgi:WD40 repeat protein
MSIISESNNATVFVSGDEIGTIYIGKQSNAGKVILKIIDQVNGPILKICGNPLKNYFFLCGDISGAIMKLTVNALLAAELKTVANHQYQVCDMDFHKNGNLLVTCSNDAIKLWDVKMDGMSPIHTIKPDVYGLRVAFHPDKSFFLVGYADQRIRMFVLEQMNTVVEVACTSRSQIGEMSNLVFEKGGKYFAATGYNLVYIYSFPSMEEVYYFRDNIEPINDITRYHISELSFVIDKKIVITTCNKKKRIQRYYNEFSKNMEIESVNNLLT